MTHTWKITVQLFDTDDLVRDGRLTTAHAVLTTSAGTTLEGHGEARRNPDDPSVPRSARSSPPPARCATSPTGSSRRRRTTSRRSSTTRCT